MRPVLAEKPALDGGRGWPSMRRKVNPDDIVDKEVVTRYGMVDGGSSSEPLRPSPYNPTGKILRLTGYSECTSPTTPCSFACSLFPGIIYT